MLKKVRFLLPTCLAFGALIAPLNDLLSIPLPDQVSQANNKTSEENSKTDKVILSDMGVTELAYNKLQGGWLFEKTKNIGTNIIESRTRPLCQVKYSDNGKDKNMNIPVTFTFRTQDIIGLKLTSNEQIIFADIAQAIVDMYSSTSPTIVSALDEGLLGSPKFIQMILDHIEEASILQAQDTTNSKQFELSSILDKYDGHIGRLINGLIILHQYNSEETKLAAALVIENVDLIIDTIANNQDSFPVLFPDSSSNGAINNEYNLKLHPVQDNENRYSVEYKAIDDTRKTLGRSLYQSLMTFIQALVDISDLNSTDFERIIDARSKAEQLSLSKQEQFAAKVLESIGYKNIMDWSIPTSSEVTQKEKPINKSSNQLSVLLRQSDDNEVYKICVSDVLDEGTSELDNCGFNISETAQTIVSYFVYNFPFATHRMQCVEDLLQENDQRLDGVWLHRAIELANEKSVNHNPYECDAESYLAALNKVNSLSPNYNNFDIEEVKKVLQQLKELINQFAGLDDGVYSGKFPLLKIQTTFLGDDGSIQNRELVSIVEINGKVVNRNNQDRQLLLVGAFVDLTNFILDRVLKRLSESTREKSE